MTNGAVWGIDIGQCALKALRCRVSDDGDSLIAEAFDYIEYPKILSQPGAEPAELVGEALKQFLSRNSLIGDRVAVSVSGQAGLARFIKLPPVEAKKIPDIVRYEARQQIPFDLNDVVWDYQRMGGGSVEEGFALETEVGLFAMKRDAVLRALEPFAKAGIEVDIVQLTPLVLYNFLVFDQLRDLPSPEEYDPEDPPESVVIVSLGTDATDLVVTNGFRVWQRSIPLGGNHFTKALTKELKLTFAKAEHLKRNATAAPDPKAVFQAMRPVFADLLTELQRSIGYFSNVDRSAKIGRVVALGNAMRLPGLRRYLSQSLGYEIEKLDSFQRLGGPQVVNAPSFKENLLSFGVAYGLALQGLGKAAVHTNLLPKEIILDRLIGRKKPWAIAAAALLLLGCGISFAAYSLALAGVDASRWGAAEAEAAQLVKEKATLQSGFDQAMTDFKKTDEIGQHLVGNVEGRIRWLELLKAVNQCLPKDEHKPDAPLPPISERNELHVTNFDCTRFEDIGQWYDHVKRYDQAPQGAEAQAPKPAGDATSETGEGDEATAGPHGPGWMIRLTGYHYHNADQINQGAEYVLNTLVANLRKAKVKLPSPETHAMKEFSMAQLGISYPVLVNPLRVEDAEVADPNAVAVAAPAVNIPTRGAGKGGGGGMVPGAMIEHEAADAAKIKLRVFRFDVQFCWQPEIAEQARTGKPKPPSDASTAEEE